MRRLMTNSICMAFVWLFGCLSFCFAQDTNYTKKGKIISEGEAVSMGTELKVASYRLERINLDKPFPVADKEPPLQNAFRLVLVTKEDLPLDDISFWIDDSPYWGIQIRSNEVAILLFARRLPSRMKLGLSRRGKNDPADRAALVESIFVPAEYATPLQEAQSTVPIIQLRRIPPTNRGVELGIELPFSPCVATATPIFIAIDDQGVATTCRGPVYIHWFSSEQFAQLRNGADIVLKKGVGSEARVFRVVGVLNKNSVN